MTKQVIMLIVTVLYELWNQNFHIVICKFVVTYVSEFSLLCFISNKIFLNEELSVLEELAVLVPLTGLFPCALNRGACTFILHRDLHLCPHLAQLFSHLDPSSLDHLEADCDHGTPGICLLLLNLGCLLETTFLH